MVAALQKYAPEVPPKRITVNIPTISNKQLHHFVTRNSTKLFQLMLIPDSFLEADPETWMTNPEYLRGKEIERELQVVNDTVERGVALIQEYSRLLTKGED